MSTLNTNTAYLVNKNQTQFHNFEESKEIPVVSWTAPKNSTIDSRSITKSEEY